MLYKLSTKRLVLCSTLVPIVAEVQRGDWNIELFII